MLTAEVLLRRSVGVLYLLVGGTNLMRNGFKYGLCGMWIIKTSLVVLAAGCFDLFELASFGDTLWFCLQLPIFPLFNELSKEHSHSFFKYMPSLLVTYWQVFGWMIQHVNAPLRKQIDNVVFTVMWALLLWATRFSAEYVVVRGGQNTQIDPRNGVWFACIPSVIMRWLPYPAAAALDDWAALAGYAGYHLCFAYTLHCVLSFLVAAQADDQGHYAELKIVALVLPVASWVPMTTDFPEKKQRRRDFSASPWKSTPDILAPSISTDKANKAH